MQTLPMDGRMPEIVATLKAHQALVLIAPPGAGKTTRVPPGIIAADLLGPEHRSLIMLQPRRVAARACAQRIADERAWRLGEEVGYHIRFEKRYARHTPIRILTEAILTRMLLADPELPGIGCVILDEFHERNVHSDLALAFLREIQQTIRPDLKIVVMSATLDARPVAAFLGDAPVIAVEGRQHPVDIVYRSPRDRPLESQVADAIHEALDAGDGDVLTFLPGVGEIQRACRALAPLVRAGVAVLPLHGSLSSEDQQRALRPGPRGCRKVILATNIAETSLTIDGVRSVVDSGLARVASFDPDRGMDRLDLQRISAASAAQRAGRAGRQAPGHAYRLWPQTEHKHLAEFNVPEVRRIDLSGTVLALHAWGARNPRAFGWFEPPDEPMLVAAEGLLEMLGALAGGAITGLGRRMLQVPAHPRIARLLLAAAGTPMEQDAPTLAAILADDSRASSPCDPLALLQRPPAHLTRVRDQFAQILNSLPPSAGGHKASGSHELTDLLLLAYPDRVARRRGADPHSAIMVGGLGLRLAPEALTAALVSAPLFLAIDVHHDPRNRKAESTVRAAIPLQQETLHRLHPEAFRVETTLEYSPQRQKPQAVIRHYFGDLLLAEKLGTVHADASGQVLARALAPQAGDLFRQHPSAARILARVAFLRRHMPEHPWPAFDEPQLRELLVDACAGKGSRGELTESSALPNALRGALAYPLDRLLDEHAPDALGVPSGSRIRLEYRQPATPGADPPPPVLAVRLQELFGWTRTPRVAAGRVAVLLHLLSPGFKPIQVTSDLASFWRTAYFEVRKDLRVRYPKHKWPEDPLAATPQAKGRRRPGTGRR